MVFRRAGNAQPPRDPEADQDERLIFAAARGDLDSFNKLVLRHERSVLNLCWRMLGTLPEAEDASQDAFIKAWTNAKTFKGGAVRPWLLRIATNTCYDILRAKGRKPTGSLDALEFETEPDWSTQSAPVDPVRFAETGDLSRMLEAALAQIPDEQRLAVTLCDIQGLPLAEAADGDGNLDRHRQISPLPRTRQVARTHRGVAHWQGTSPLRRSFSLQRKRMTMPSSEHQSNRRDEHLTDAELNELVDGTLAGRELNRAQAHLDSCQDCDARYRALLATVTALKQAPSLMPRRSFQLTPEQAKRPDPVPSRIDRFADWIVPGIPVIKLATIAVALLFISVTAFDVLTNQSGQDDINQSTALQRDSDLPAPAVQNAQSEATEAPIPGDSNASISDAGKAETALEANDAAGGAVDSDTASDSVSSSAMQEAPAAPAAAIEQPGLFASPTVASTPTPTLPATVEPIPTPSAEATPIAGPKDRSGGLALSSWRIAELGLLMVLIWLLVSWIGRSRVGQPDE